MTLRGVSLEEGKMICHLCGALVGFNEGVMFGASNRPAGARLAHAECVAVETLGLIYRREVDRTLGSLARQGA